MANSGGPTTKESLPKEKEEVIPAVTPGLQFFFSFPVGKADGYLLEADSFISQGLYLDLFRKRHSVAFQIHPLEALAIKDPHARL